VAQFKLTFKELRDEAEHAAGGAPDARVPTARTVNAALEYLCQFHPWRWRVALTTLSTVNAQGTILLPDDFGELIDVQGYQLKTTGIKKAQPRMVMAARVNNGALIASTYAYVFYIGQGPQTDVTLPPPRTLELGPVPGSSTVDAFYLTYRRMLPSLAADTDVPAIPYGYFNLLRTLVRAMAVSSTVQQSGHDWELFNRMVGDFCAADGTADGVNEGVMRDQVDAEGWHYGAEHTLGPGTQILMPGDVP
jgi:hypothetical protein